METLTSKIDASVNFVIESEDGGFYECRYVRREENTVICYLSSHSGCNMGCRMCHLTATKQTMMRSASFNDFERQLSEFYGHYLKIAKTKPAKYIHYNFMARGEPLANELILSNWNLLAKELIRLALAHGLIPKIKISTILPRTYRDDLEKTFAGVNPTIYWSVYSHKKEFRDKWLPAAKPFDEAIKTLSDYSNFGGNVRLHCAFIKGENNRFEDVSEMMRKIPHGIGRMNIVRYNPYSPEYGEEADGLNVLQALSLRENGEAQIIPRVGQDVYGSCGMFYEKGEK